MNTISKKEGFDQKLSLFQGLVDYDGQVIMQKSISISDNKSKENLDFIEKYKNLAKTYEKVMGIKIFDFTNDDSFIGSAGNYIKAIAKIEIGA